MGEKFYVFIMTLLGIAMKLGPILLVLAVLFLLFERFAG